MISLRCLGIIAVVMDGTRLVHYSACPPCMAPAEKEAVIPRIILIAEGLAWIFYVAVVVALVVLVTTPPVVQVHTENGLVRGTGVSLDRSRDRE